MKKKANPSGDSAIDLLEEAVHLLRGASVNLLGAYAVGTLPFVFALLYYCADMSRGAFARSHSGRGAVAMGLLYLWMKCWQAVFAAGLRSQRTGQPLAPWTVGRVASLALKQSALQPSGLFAVPLALVIMIPFGWVLSFYENLTALGAEPGGVRALCKAASRQASSRPGQNHLLLGFLSVFVFFVWLNVATTMAWLPYLLKTLFGVETAFTQAGVASMFNTTYIACSFALTYICVDPLIKAVFVLRSFYGQSLQSGEDLKFDLAGLRATAILAVIPSAELNKSIDKVLQRPEFAWRMPREELKDTDAGQQSWLGHVTESVVKVIKDVGRYCLDSLGKAVKWIGEQLGKMWPNSHNSEFSGWSSGWSQFLQIVLLILIVIVAGLLAVLILRLWQKRRRLLPVVTATATVAPDLNDENIAADQLPEEGWLKMARDMMAAGNLRLALRAFYLAGLANLAARELIAIASFKSNHEYEAELRRRARALPAVQNAFSQNVAAFDRAWYGLHEVTQEALQQFQSNLEQIRAC